MDTLAEWLSFLVRPFGLTDTMRVALGAGLAICGLAGLIALAMRRRSRRIHQLPARSPAVQAERVASAPPAAARPASPSRPLPDVMTEVLPRQERVSAPSLPLKIARDQFVRDPVPSLPLARSAPVATHPTPQLLIPVPPDAVFVSDPPAEVIATDSRAADTTMEGLDLLVPQEVAPETRLPSSGAGDLVVVADPAELEAERQYQNGLRLLAGASEQPMAARDAIGCFRRTLDRWTREGAPERWATVNNAIGRAYQELLEGDRAANLNAAIEHHLAALEVFDPQRHPMQWAWTQSALGAACQSRPVGTPIAAARAAIAYHKRALDVYSQENAPLAWAWNLNNLGAANENMRGGAEGEWVERLREAAACYQDALEVYTAAAYPMQHQIVARNLARVRSELRALE